MLHLKSQDQTAPGFTKIKRKERRPDEGELNEHTAEGSIVKATANADASLNKRTEISESTAAAVIRGLEDSFETVTDPANVQPPREPERVAERLWKSNEIVGPTVGIVIIETEDVGTVESKSGMAKAIGNKAFEKGKNVTRKAKEFDHEVTEKAEDAFEKSKEVAGTLVDKGKEVIDGVKTATVETGKELASGIKAGAQGAIEKSKELAETVVEVGKGAIAGAQEAYHEGHQERVAEKVSAEESTARPGIEITYVQVVTTDRASWDRVREVLEEGPNDGTLNGRKRSDEFLSKL
jgi:hypothetical protein